MSEPWVQTQSIPDSRLVQPLRESFWTEQDWDRKSGSVKCTVHLPYLALSSGPAADGQGFWPSAIRIACGDCPASGKYLESQVSCSQNTQCPYTCLVIPVSLHPSLSLSLLPVSTESCGYLLEVSVFPCVLSPGHSFSFHTVKRSCSTFHSAEKLTSTQSGSSIKTFSHIDKHIHTHAMESTLISENTPFWSTHLIVMWLREAPIRTAYWKKNLSQNVLYSKACGNKINE